MKTFEALSESNPNEIMSRHLSSLELFIAFYLCSLPNLVINSAFTKYIPISANWLSTF